MTSPLTSGSSGDARGPREITRLNQDMGGALAYVEKLATSSIVPTVASMGGTTSIDMAAPQEANDTGGLSGTAEFHGQEAFANLKQVQMPKLLKAAHGDLSGHPNLEPLYDFSPCEQLLLTIEDFSAHGTDLLKRTEASKMREDVIGFVERTLQQ